MKIQNFKNVEGMKAAPGVTMRIVAGEAEKAPTFVMRVFEIEPGSATPYHAHPWEHEVFLLDGQGKLKTNDKEIPLSQGDAAMVLPNEQHSFINAGDKMLRMICVVPLVNGKMPGMPTKD